MSPESSCKQKEESLSTCSEQQCQSVILLQASGVKESPMERLKRLRAAQLNKTFQKDVLSNAQKKANEERDRHARLQIERVAYDKRRSPSPPSRWSESPCLYMSHPMTNPDVIAGLGGLLFSNDAVWALRVWAAPTQQALSEQCLRDMPHIRIICCESMWLRTWLV